MTYDAAAFEKALERPSITVRRGWLGRKITGEETKTYTGRLLSHPEWLPFERRLRTLAETPDDELDEDTAMKVYRDFLLAIEIPPHIVFRLPPAVMWEALQSFFDCQKRAVEAAGPPTERNGSDRDGGRLKAS